MLIVMDAHATTDQIERVCAEVRDMGFAPHPMPGPTRTAIGVTGNEGAIAERGRIQVLPGVADVIRVTKPYKLVSREWQEADSIVEVGNVEIGGTGVVVIAGPCTIESRDQTLDTARAVVAQGATIVRGGAYKPRTSPYNFQGLGEEGLRYLADVRDTWGTPVVTEVMDVETLPVIERYADMLQIGARNMQNYSLLKAVGRSTKPVLLKRGFSATVTDLLLAAEYVLSEGNRSVVLCERGLRTFNDHSRFTLDLAAIPVLKSLTHLPIIVDPSHASGYADRVIPMARAAIAAGADGLIVEVHPEPAFAVCDGPQSLTFSRFTDMMHQVGRVAAAVDRTVVGRETQITL